MKSIISLVHPLPRIAQLRFNKPIMWNIKEGEQWCIIGPNGAGKTLLTDMILGRTALCCSDGGIKYCFDQPFHKVIKSIAFKDIYSIVDSGTTYYQQRWHATEREGIITVREMLDGMATEAEMGRFFAYFNVSDILDKSVICLSSGELRKFLLIRVLLTHPKVLIMDNPYIGLDEKSRSSLNDMFSVMSGLNGLQIILLLSNPDDIPDMITNVMPVLDKECMDAVTRSEFLGNEKLIERMFGDDSEDIVLPAQLRIASSHKVTFRMESVGIAHGKRTILKDINWEVRNGEKWGLMGPNGSGKSTLLSLVYADNPQSYANCIYLFDRKRGTGESIWDIKERIGYVSPEMHLYYMEDIPALQIVGSGFFDSIGIYRHCSEEQSAISLQWMKTFGVEHLASVSFLKLSSGEQRLVLLARAFVKDPDLLVLDEPLHGLDIKNKRRATRIIEAFCNRTGKSLVYVTHYPHEMPPSVDKEFRLCKN